MTQPIVFIAAYDSPLGGKFNNIRTCTGESARGEPLTWARPNVLWISTEHASALDNAGVGLKRTKQRLPINCGCLLSGRPTLVNRQSCEQRQCPCFRPSAPCDRPPCFVGAGLKVYVVLTVLRRPRLFGPASAACLAADHRKRMLSCQSSPQTPNAKKRKSFGCHKRTHHASASPKRLQMHCKRESATGVSIPDFPSHEQSTGKRPTCKGTANARPQAPAKWTT